MEKLSWNPFDAGYKEDPVSFMASLSKQGPIHRAINGHWVLTGYHVAKSVLGDSRFHALDLSGKIRVHGEHLPANGGLNGIAGAMKNWILYMNPPEHSTHRSAIFKIWKDFHLEAFIERLTADLLRQLIRKKTVDFIKAFATPLPVGVTNHILGLEKIDNEILRDWSAKLARTQEPFSGLREFQAAEETAEHLRIFLGGQIEGLRKQPQANNFISKITSSQDIDNDDLISMINLLFLAGIETSVTIFGNIVSFLIDHPDVLTVIRQNPGKLENAVNELLRLNNSARYVARVASENCILEGIEIKAGDTIYLSLYSANRDPEVFNKPKDFDIDRHHNPHLSFGYGPHYCLGAQLSKLEIRIFLEQVTGMGLSFEENGPRLVDKRSVIFRRMLELPVRVLGAA